MNNRREEGGNEKLIECPKIYEKIKILSDGINLLIYVNGTEVQGVKGVTFKQESGKEVELSIDFFVGMM